MRQRAFFYIFCPAEALNVSILCRERCFRIYTQDAGIYESVCGEYIQPAVLRKRHEINLQDSARKVAYILVFYS